MNTSIEPKFSLVENSTLKIVEASIGTLTTQKAIEDLVTTYGYARTNSVDFNLTSIDPSVEAGGAQSFDTAYMRKLYQIGYETALPGGFWRKSPPAVAADRVVPGMAMARRLPPAATSNPALQADAGGR